MTDPLAGGGGFLEQILGDLLGLMGGAGATDGARELTATDILDRLDRLDHGQDLILQSLGEPCDAPWDGKRTDASVVSLLKAICLKA